MTMCRPGSICCRIYPSWGYLYQHSAFVEHLPHKIGLSLHINKAFCFSVLLIKKEATDYTHEQYYGYSGPTSPIKYSQATMSVVKQHYHKFSRGKATAQTDSCREKIANAQAYTVSCSSFHIQGTSPAAENIFVLGSEKNLQSKCHGTFWHRQCWETM